MSVMADSLENESAATLLSMKDGGRIHYGGQPPSTQIGRRGVPPRIRKRNRLIFNDDEDTTFHFSRSPRKNPRVSSPPPLPAQTVTPAATALATISAAAKRSAQHVYSRLKNILKLPKAHKWVCYEWFYSNLDQALLLGENDFCACLRESFPELKTRRLTRIEWCKIRRCMGKPRRCSSAFFNEEINALHVRRQKIRQLQQRKVVDLANFRDLPDEIPLPLVIGTKVTVRLRKPQDGLFMGSIDAVDTSNATYRITLDRQGLGTHSIPDYEVLSNEPQERMPISAFALKQRPRNPFCTPPRFRVTSPSQQLENDPLLSSSTMRPGLPVTEEGTLGGFPVKFLILLVRLSKILSVKREKLDTLKEMNTEAEKMQSYQIQIPLEFQKKYAKIILEFEKLNKDLNDYLVGVHNFCLEIAPEQGLQPVSQPDLMRQQAMAQAEEITIKAKMENSIKSDRILNLITQLTSLMFQVKCLAENELNSFEFKSLSDSLSDIQSKLEPQNVSVFQNHVEIHVKHVEAGLSQMGNLHAFTAQHIPGSFGH